MCFGCLDSDGIEVIEQVDGKFVDTTTSDAHMRIVSSQLNYRFIASYFFWNISSRFTRL